MEPKELKLIVPEMATISRSYERTINPKNYVPNFDYESHKLSSFRSRQIPVTTPIEEQDKISAELLEIVRREVEIAATELINGLKREAGIAVEPTGEEYKAIADLIVAFESATTAEEVKKASEMAKERKDKLNDTQLEYLRTILRKADARAL